MALAVSALIHLLPNPSRTLRPAPPCCRGSSTADLLESIRKDAIAWPDRRAYLLLHNIDGPGESLWGPAESLMALVSPWGGHGRPR